MASPPSSTISVGPGPSGQRSARKLQRQYSASVSPFHANTGTPCGLCAVPSRPTTTAAAASSWVEKMLQDAQRTCAPKSTRVSISTAVCTVMCSDPVMRAPASGRASMCCARRAISPGISVSASSIWSRPAAAKLRSATSKSSIRLDAWLMGSPRSWSDSLPPQARNAFSSSSRGIGPGSRRAAAATRRLSTSTW